MTESVRRPRPFRRFLLMVQFFTRLPVPVSMDCSSEEFGRSLLYAPAVGLLIGAILSVAWLGLRLLLPPLAVSVGLLVLYVLLTGGLHLDGLGDTFDGLFSGRSRDRMLEIMRDSRIGTNALLAVVLLLLSDAALLTAAQESISGVSVPFLLLLLFFPMCGRIGTVVGAALHPYAREGEGLGRSFIQSVTPRDLLIVLPAYAVPTFSLAWVCGHSIPLAIGFAFLVVLAAVSSALLSSSFARRIGGVTGDVLGALCEIVQLLVLLAGTLLLRFPY